jgi:hypothetical protein
MDASTEAKYQEIRDEIVSELGDEISLLILPTYFLSLTRFLTPIMQVHLLVVVMMVTPKKASITPFASFCALLARTLNHWLLYWTTCNGETLHLL